MSGYAEDPHAYWALHPDTEREWDGQCGSCAYFRACPGEGCEWGWCEQYGEFYLADEVVDCDSGSEY